MERYIVAVTVVAEVAVTVVAEVAVADISTPVNRIFFIRPTFLTASSQTFLKTRIEFKHQKIFCFFRNLAITKSICTAKVFCHACLLPASGYEDK
jgi:hypothetical protein